MTSRLILIKPVNDFDELGLFSVTYSSNSMQASVPLSAIDSTDGLMNFKVTSAIQHTDYSSSGVTDYLTPVGQAPGTVQAEATPEPASCALALYAVGLLIVLRARTRHVLV
jgi:hypothetical protein